MMKKILLLAAILLLPTWASAGDASIKLPSVNGADAFVVQDKYANPKMRIASDGATTITGTLRVSGGLQPDFDSGWVADNNATNHKTTIAHNLGVFPSKVTIWFAANNNPTTVYPLKWFHLRTVSGGPVSIEYTRTAIILNVFNGQPLFGVWNGTTTAWTSYTNGFWRVKVWK